MADRHGQQLGNYQLLRLLGQGGFADVYLGQHIHLDSQAAIKVLQVRLTGSALEQFRGEGRALARLLHPNIVRVFDFGVENDTPFLVMDFAPNGSLRQHYPKGTILSPATILPHLTQVARALQYAHDRKLIHRDVKPENMLLGPTNEVLLSDFGLVLHAQSTASQTTKEMAGTLPYMAPEQITGKPRPASDQYALGIVLYEWLSGDRPFHGSLIEIATQHLMTPPAPLYGKVPGMTRALQEVVFTALAKDFQQRFANMEAFATAFEQACRAAPRSSLSLASGADSLQQTPLPPSASNSGLPGQSQQLPSLETCSGESQQPTYIHPLMSQSQQSPLITTPSNTPQPGSIDPPTVSSQEPTRTPTSSHLWPPSKNDPWPTFSVSASNGRAIGATHVQQPQTGEVQPPNVVTLPATTAPRLRILDTSGNTVRSIELTQQAYTLGRQDSNDLVLNEQGISQQHLRIVWDGQHVSITDLGSSNGTYLEGTRLIPQVSHDWQNRQMVGVGPYWLRLEGLDKALTMTARGTLPTTPSAGTFTPPAQDTPAIVNSNRIGISITTRTLSIIPGQSTGVRVSLTNLGSTVDWFTTTVEGVPPNWVQGAGQERQLNPGMQETVDLTVNVARSPHNRAQDYPVLIGVICAKLT